MAAAAAAAVVAALDAVKDDGEGDGGVLAKGKVKPTVIEKIYRELIIPMTKDIEVAYLFLRCGREPPPEYASATQARRLRQRDSSILLQTVHSVDDDTRRDKSTVSFSQNVTHQKNRNQC